VKDQSKDFMNADEFLAWVEAYDTMELKYVEVALPDKIDKVFVSRQQRALKSAAYFDFDSEVSDLLVEVKAQTFMSGKIRLPKKLWKVIDRLRWYFDLRKVENRSHTIKRARDFMEKVKDIEDVFVVSHGLFIYVLINELKKEGFTGSVGKKIENATIYTFKKELSKQ